VRYLTEIGIPVYALRGSSRGGEMRCAELAETPSGGPAAETRAAARLGAAPAEPRTAERVPDGVPAAPGTARVPADSAGTQAVGIVQRDDAIVRRDGGVQRDDGIVQRDDDAWRALEAAVRDCTRCPLHRGRTQTVFGVGRRDASLLVVGEAPGEEEDRQGEPFVGPAGRLLNAMLRAIGLSREQVYIANILKCRPPGNRDPRPEEADACSEFLDRQIAMIEPRAMLAV